MHFYLKPTFRKAAFVINLIFFQEFKALNIKFSMLPLLMHYRRFIFFIYTHFSFFWMIQRNRKTSTFNLKNNCMIRKTSCHFLVKTEKQLIFLIMQLFSSSDQYAITTLITYNVNTCDFIWFSMITRFWLKVFSSTL